MAKDLWLPNGLKLDDGTTVSKLLYSGEEWQIFSTSESDNMLLATGNLAAKWCEDGFLKHELLKEVKFGNCSYQALFTHSKYTLAPLADMSPPKNKVDGLALAFALKASRDISETASFHDAIYVERYSILLPTWTLSPKADDATIFGSWLTGGVNVSAKSFRRLVSLTGRIPKEDLVELITAAGLDVTNEYKSLLKEKIEARQGERTKKPVVKSSGDRGPEEGKKFTLPGRLKLESFFNDHIIDIITNQEKYKALGVPFPAPIILYGPPGCGKTFAVERLVEFIDWPTFSIDSSSIGSPYIHETSRKISEVFEKAIDAAPSVIVIDEMESFLSSRQTGAESGMHHVEEVGEFLRRIPEAVSKNVVIIAMTNMIELIDPAILRRGRFDHVIQVDMPTKTEIESLLEDLLVKLPTEANLTLKPLLDKLTGKPLSDAAFVVREAARIAAKSNKRSIDNDSLLAALASLSDQKDDGKNPFGFA
jgi:Cdc6-like AAA superfamily ATPase